MSQRNAIELIQWILLLQDTQVLNEIQNLKEKSVENSTDLQPRQFGCGKGIFTYVADDFDATPPGFEKYMLP
jgi:hypothetical protein